MLFGMGILVARLRRSPLCSCACGWKRMGGGVSCFTSINREFACLRHRFSPQPFPPPARQAAAQYHFVNRDARRFAHILMFNATIIGMPKRCTDGTRRLNLGANWSHSARRPHIRPFFATRFARQHRVTAHRASADTGCKCRANREYAGLSGRRGKSALLSLYRDTGVVAGV